MFVFLSRVNKVDDFYVSLIYGLVFFKVVDLNYEIQS